MTLWLLMALSGGAVTVAALLAAVRQWETAVWRRQLVPLRLRIPTGLCSEDFARWLAALAALTHAPRGALLPSPPVVLEATATVAGLEYRLLVPAPLQSAVLSSIGAMLSGVRVEPIEQSGVVSATAPQRPPRAHLMAAALRLAGSHRQLAVERADAGNRTLAAALQPAGIGDRITWQWIITGAGTPPPISSDVAHSDLPWWLEEQAPADADGLRAARLKLRQPLLYATARLVVEAPTHAQANQLFGRAWGGIRLLNVPGARLIRDYRPVWLVAAQFRRRSPPSFGWPLRLNAAELAGLMPWPVGDEPLAGMSAAITRQVPPPTDLSLTGTVLADSSYPGQSRPLRISRADRLMHVALLGPTGTGKSTLMINMALQDVVARDGLALLDPKADMAADMLDRIPEARWDDVIVVNPADSARPVGFNPLATDGSEQQRELAVDHVLHVFREQWSDFWGPRTDAVLRSALLTLTAARALDGSAFTIIELPRMLTDSGFRRSVTATPNLPGSVREFWAWFEGLSKAEQPQVVGPVLNKLTALTQRTPLRLILGQSQGINLSQVIRERKLLIMPLSRGLVGSETATLLSSLMIASLWQAILGRVRTNREGRDPFWLYIDEASEVVRLPFDMADMLSQARGLGTGVVAAIQFVKQLPPDTRSAWLSTVRTQIAFQLEPDDARLLARSFGPTLSEQDLRSLPAHEVAARLSIDGQTSRPMTGLTRPLPETLGTADRLRAASRQRYGRDRASVEAGLIERGKFQGAERTVGERPSRRRPS